MYQGLEQLSASTRITTEFQSLYLGYYSRVSITLELTEFELQIVLKALLNEADRDRAYRQMGVSDTLSNVVDQIEAQTVTVKKPVQRETTPGKKEKRA